MKTYLISPLYAKCPKRHMRGFNDWEIKIYSPCQKVVRVWRVERYIDALRLVQLLQLHLNDEDRIKAA